MLGQAKAPAAPAPAPAQPENKTRSFWQGIVKWGPAGQGDENMFTLVVASTVHFDAQQQVLALPWPNLLSVSAFVPAAPSELQKLIASRRVPCVLMTLRAFPPNAAVRGSENNERNYRTLAAMLLQNQRAAYIPHGAPQCGLLLAAVGRRSGGPPQLLALVFQGPVPFAQLAAQTSAASAANTRGMIAMPQAPATPLPTAPFPQNDGMASMPTPTPAPPAMPSVFPMLQTMPFTQPAPNPTDSLTQLLGQTPAPMQQPSADLQTVLLQQLLGQQQQQQQQQPRAPDPPTAFALTPEQLRALGLNSL